MEDEGWDDEYSDEEEDDMRQSSPMNKSLDDLRDEFGFSDCTNLMFSNTTIEEPVESDDSEDDDDETRPLQFDDSSPIPSPANSRLLPSTSCPTSPFWFGDEDSGTKSALSVQRAGDTFFVWPRWRAWPYFGFSPYLGFPLPSSASSGSYYPLPPPHFSPLHLLRVL